MVGRRKEHTCCEKQKVKRGVWSPDEDRKLVKYMISPFRCGPWTSVPARAGLQRCGKSCRLRWINYLRPGLKRGNFTRQEVSLIIELHRMLGNKWSEIVKHLPAGRTDNEIKNFWNSSIRKKIMAATSKPPPNSSGSENLTATNTNNNVITMEDKNHVLKQGDGDIFYWLDNDFILIDFNQPPSMDQILSENGFENFMLGFENYPSFTAGGGLDHEMNNMSMTTLLNSSYDQDSSLTNSLVPNFYSDPYEEFNELMFAFESFSPLAPSPSLPPFPGMGPFFWNPPM